MEFRPTDVRLPVQQIRNANLSWVRRHPEPDDALLDSLETNGIQLPLLLTNELIVADGARRLHAAERLGWREVPVVATTDWDIVTQYFAEARRLEAAGQPHIPMGWAEIVDLIAGDGPMDLLYRRRRLERGRASRAASAQRRAAGLKGPAKRDNDYVAEVAAVLGWKQSDLRPLREAYWTLSSIELQEAADRKAARQQGGEKAADALPRRAELLRDEIERLEKDGGTNEAGLGSLLKKLKWVAAGNDPAHLKLGRAQRRVGDPTFAERKAAAAANAAAVGRELDGATLVRISQVLASVGIEADAYTHLRPSVRTQDATAAAQAIRLAVNKINRLNRVVRAYAENLEERS